MADVFISYASRDRERAGKMASALEARGWTVWWDRKLIVGESYDQAIERELEAAKCVVVLWSKNAVLSEWVKNEAALAAERGVLLPALIDDVKLPLEFRRKQTADLVDWNGDSSHSGFTALCDGIAAKAGAADIAARAGSATPASPQQSNSPAPSGSRQTRFPVLIVITLIAMAAAAGVYWAVMRETPPSQLSTSREAVKSDAKVSSEIADSVVGTYYGDVVADSKGSSQTDVTVTITKLGARRVMITSDYERLGTAELELSRSGNAIVGNGGEATLSVDMDKTPPRLDYNPGGVVYAGEKR
ncbi:MAG TPA: toll/interleukin-1 receptor domain-containing protein [Pyrinomonadaceae bacterium]|nr:toll/interleukin-1 receptor domain-containing protein [Pyrinomonadaceae bacterium]